VHLFNPPIYHSYSIKILPSSSFPSQTSSPKGFYAPANSLYIVRPISYHGLPANSPNYLLKTFSINPFQGQYPNMAVRITTTPINPRIQRKTPEMKKARIISMTPVIKRKIPSPLPTFLTFTTGFSSLNSSALNKKPHSFFRNRVTIHLQTMSHPMG
jgi:hypothetical protein